MTACHAGFAWDLGVATAGGQAALLLHEVAGLLVKKSKDWLRERRAKANRPKTEMQSH